MRRGYVGMWDSSLVVWCRRPEEKQWELIELWWELRGNRSLETTWCSGNPPKKFARSLRRIVTWPLVPRSRDSSKRHGKLPISFPPWLSKPSSTTAAATVLFGFLSSVYVYIYTHLFSSEERFFFHNICRECYLSRVR